MTDLLQLLIAGLATGAIYALAAIGFTLLWQTSQTINFAQGEFVMVPAFLALIAMKWFGVPFLGALVLAVLASMLLLGVVFRFVVVAPLIKRGVLPLVVSDHRAQHHPEGIVKGFTAPRPRSSRPCCPMPRSPWPACRCRRRSSACWRCRCW
jgi:hypothetical protein